MPRVRVGDINMYYEVHGEGFPLVLIMGTAANSAWWTPTGIEQFSKRFKTVIFDNRGMGRTDVPEGGYTMPMMAEDTVGLMDALGIDQAHLFGISLGGGIALETVLSYPDRVSKLVLVSTYCGGPNSKGNPPPSEPRVLEDLVELMEMIQKGEHKGVARMMASWMFSEDYLKNNPDVLEGFVARYLVAPVTLKGLINQQGYVATYDTYDRLPQISKPTLILHGRDDIVVPVRNAEILAEGIRGAELVIYDNTGHGMSIQAEKDFLKRVIEFLKK
ncbi:MAG: alpha/beta fold hydrolase [Candidatus Lokiarchaeia archaeon]